MGKRVIENKRSTTVGACLAFRVNGQEGHWAQALNGDRSITYEHAFRVTADTDMRAQVAD